MNLRLFVLIILASIGFYNPFAIFSPQMQKLMTYALILFALGYTFIRQPEAGKGTRYPRLEYIVLLGGIFISIFMGSAFHLQSLKDSLITTLPYLFGYGFFYVLLKLDVERPKIIKAYFVLLAISCVIYVINLFWAPFNIFGAPMLGEDLTRGILRVKIEYIEMFPLLIFYCINRWLIDHRGRWLWLIAFGLVMVFMSVTRQIIAATVVLGLLFMFRSVSWKVKLLMSLGVVVVVVWILPLIPIYNTMMELSEEQRDKNEEVEDIRFVSWRYYTYENQTNDITPFFGNGVPAAGKSLWGIMWDTETDENGCFYVDVGWAGFFWLFGAFATAALATLLLKALFKRKPPQRQYLTYWFIFLVVTAFASGPIIYFSQVLNLCVCLYLVYRKDPDDDLPPQLISSHSTAKDDELADSSDNTDVQQRRRYPQLHKVGD